MPPTKTKPDGSGLKSFTVVSFILCDDVRREVTGKEILIGVYNNVIIFPSFPASLQNMVFRVSVKPGKFGMTSVLFTVHDESKNATVMNSEQKIDFPHQDALFNIGYGVAGYQFTQSTTLKPTISFDGERHPLPEIIVRLPDTDDERNQVKPI